MWTSIGGAVAVIATGYLVDFFTIGTIFYIASILYVVSGIVLSSKKILTIPIFTLIPFICYTKREYKRKGDSAFDEIFSFSYSYFVFDSMDKK